ncbi:uncharacterized protein PgNI_08425 [Pyricularia grisea]|uniref:Uncharacterized protein n=1 Tax=Pyricularia grisea TaxID=148305 RepID=A0A6P8AWM5_PYRGI|nr:uncharacterized protein PgNI_08425 [Pyricularia grisea]TLD06623.1 hypothetical protein PgNI_08425 [Pyricularia grisea]
MAQRKRQRVNSPTRRMVDVDPRRRNPFRFSSSFATRWAASPDKVKEKNVEPKPKSRHRNQARPSSREPMIWVTGSSRLPFMEVMYMRSHGTGKGVVGSKAATFALSLVSLLGGERGERYAEQAQFGKAIGSWVYRTRNWAYRCGSVFCFIIDFNWLCWSNQQYEKLRRNPDRQQRVTLWGPGLSPVGGTVKVS